MGSAKWAGIRCRDVAKTGLSGETSPREGTSSTAALFSVSAESLGDAKKEDI